MNSTNNKEIEIYYFDPARDKEKLNPFNPVKEIKKVMKAYKLASSGENAEFSASLATLALTAASISLTMQPNKLGERNLKKAEELINSNPEDPTIKLMIKLICHDPSQTIMF